MFYRNYYDDDDGDDDDNQYHHIMCTISYKRLTLSHSEQGGIRIMELETLISKKQRWVWLITAVSIYWNSHSKTKIL